MRIAVVGAGAWGINITRTLQELEVLSAIVEPNPHRKTALEKEFPGVPLLDSIAALKPLGLNAVAIATPVPTHFAVARAALEQGLHVFVEKPMTFSVQEAGELRNLADQLGKTLMVGHLLLYQPAIKWIANFLKEGGLGRVHSIFQERLNFGRARAAEDALWSLGVHDLAVLLHLAGREPEDYQVTRAFSLKNEVADDIHVHFKFADGLASHLHVSWLWPEKKRSTTILGEMGMLVFDEIAGTVTLHQKRITKSLEHSDHGANIVFRSNEPALKIELAHFVDCIERKSRPISDGENGLQVVKLLQGISPVRGN